MACIESADGLRDFFAGRVERATLFQAARYRADRNARDDGKRADFGSRRGRGSSARSLCFEQRCARISSAGKSWRCAVKSLDRNFESGRLGTRWRAHRSAIQNANGSRRAHFRPNATARRTNCSEPKPFRKRRKNSNRNIATRDRNRFHLARNCARPNSRDIEYSIPNRSRATRQNRTTQSPTRGEKARQSAAQNGRRFATRADARRQIVGQRVAAISGETSARLEQNQPRTVGSFARRRAKSGAKNPRFSHAKQGFQKRRRTGRRQRNRRKEAGCS